ncbi:alpha-1,3-mannosyl-glycoprotein 4-beta-N-acetylglucosaminyltransferase B-like isoform X2 [Takifugu flavidus]|uniref:alpha-1,3-mannosyl-glycoprotein 4-beta-N-acetylglucosaminyltransferase B-like isoform X2 n=1 Tax=Takifugu flavidus TaxID=433684 RepID=UPI0025440075|nr:alpha-1,3-mannosyl-glycoprotein 4-beta-N-acetylglucosaminyltransferase B-like isoform X2 [Takifugu flavidus]
MRISNLKCGLVLIALTCFPMVIWIERIPRDKDSTAVGAARWTDLQNLYEHLHLAKKMEAEVSRDLRAVLQQLNNICQPVNNIRVLPQNVAVSASKEMQQVLQRPNIHHYLPHLRQNLDSLSPNVVLGQGRHGVFLVMGIPTVKREKQSYLMNTLSSLLFSLTQAHRQHLLIIVFVAETDSEYVHSTAETIKKHFPDDVQSGLLEVVSPSPHYYPDFSTIKESLGDSKDRVRWRTKQNLDFSYLMHYAQDKGSYYIQLEDDVIAKSGYYDEIKAFTAQEASKDWLFLEFSQLGFIGKMFRTSDLHMISEFFLMFHKDKPVDWLLDHILWVKTCNPEKDAKHCNDQKALLKRQYKPSLFQHVGLHSSLLGKIQPLKDKAFETSKLYQAHNNPAAELSSSLTHYQQHSLERAYKGVDFFWALTPSQNDYILFKFLQPIHISGYLFRSGNIETSTDKFHNTTVEVLPRNASVRQKFLTSLPSAYKESDNGFIIVGAFASGLAEGAIEDVLQPICAIRLVFQSDADVWAILSEISIKV